MTVTGIIAKHHQLGAWIPIRVTPGPLAQNQHAVLARSLFNTSQGSFVLAQVSVGTFDASFLRGARTYGNPAWLMGSRDRAAKVTIWGTWSPRDQY